MISGYMHLSMWINSQHMIIYVLQKILILLMGAIFKTGHIENVFTADHVLTSPRLEAAAWISVRAGQHSFL